MRYLVQCTEAQTAGKPHDSLSWERVRRGTGARLPAPTRWRVRPGARGRSLEAFRSRKPDARDV